MAVATCPAHTHNQRFARSNHQVLSVSSTACTPCCDVSLRKRITGNTISTVSANCGDLQQGYARRNHKFIISRYVEDLGAIHFRLHTHRRTASRFTACGLVKSTVNMADNADDCSVGFPNELSLQHRSLTKVEREHVVVKFAGRLFGFTVRVLNEGFDPLPVYAEKDTAAVEVSGGMGRGHQAVDQGGRVDTNAAAEFLYAAGLAMGR